MIEKHKQAMAVEIAKIADQPWPRALPEELWKFALNPHKKKESYIEQLIGVHKHLPGILSLSFTRLFMEGGVAALYMRRETDGNKRYYEIKAYRYGGGLPFFKVRSTTQAAATKAQRGNQVVNE